MWHFENSTDEEEYVNALNSTISTPDVRLLVYYSNRAKDAPFINTRASILGSSLSNTEQSVDNTSFNLGTCYIDNVKIELDREKSIGISGARSQTIFCLEAGYGITEDNIKYVPINWYVMKSRASSLKNGKYSVELQSFMSRLDRDLPNAIKKNGQSATCLAWLHYMCSNIIIQSRPDKAHIMLELSSKMKDSAYLKKLPSLHKVVTVNAETGHVTYRDVLRDIAQINCSFATFDREGKLLLVPFRESSDEHYTISYKDLISYTENLEKFTIDAVRYAAGDREYIYDGSGTDGLFKGERYDGDYIDISDNKAMSLYTNEDNLDTTFGISNIISILSGIWHCICSVSDKSEDTSEIIGYQATPFELSLPRPDFRLDLGDWIDYTTNNTSTLASAQLMKINYSIPGTSKLCSYAAPDTTDTNASGKRSATGGNKTNKNTKVDPTTTSSYKFWWSQT